MIGIEPYRFATVSDGTVNLTFATVSQAAIAIGFSMAGIECYCFVIVFDGTVDIAL